MIWLAAPSHRGFLLAVLILSSLGSPLSPIRAQPFSLEAWSVDGGGGTSVGGGFSVQGTIGQPDAGVLAGGGFTLTGGFPGFHVVPAGSVTLAIQILHDGHVQVTWQSDETRWQLEAATHLGGAPDWQSVTVPGATSYTAAAAGARQFYRLVRR